MLWSVVSLYDNRNILCILSEQLIKFNFYRFILDASINYQIVSADHSDLKNKKEWLINGGSILVFDTDFGNSVCDF